MGSPQMTMSLAVCLTIFLLAFPCLGEEVACCQAKIVTDSGSMDGTYTYKQYNPGREPECFDGCVYSKDGAPGDEYCLQAVEKGANIEDQCGGSSTLADGSTPKVTTGNPAKKYFERKRARGLIF